MTEGDLLRTALIIPLRGRAVVCSWASVPGVFCAPFVFWQSRFAGCIFCALWAGLVFAVWHGPAALQHCSRHRIWLCRQASPLPSRGSCPAGL